MFARLGQFVARRPLVIVLAWLLVVVVLRLVAPSWNDVAHDGDLAHLPKDMTSVKGERLLAEAFPQALSRSQIAIVISRDEGELEGDDIFVGYDAGRRFKSRLVRELLRRRRDMLVSGEAFSEKQTDPNVGEGETETDTTPIRGRQTPTQLLADALQASDDALFFDDELIARFADREGMQPAFVPEVYRQRALALKAAGRLEEAREFFELLDQETQHDKTAAASADRAVAAPREPDQVDLPMLDVWTWRAPIVGAKLISEDKAARLIVIQLSTELLATENVKVLSAVEREVAAVRAFAVASGIKGLRVDISGSAAVGGDMIRSSKAMVSNTELFSGILVLLILAVVYRTPLLVAVPLISIVVALMASTSAVALLTQLHQAPGFSWLEVKVFTTSRIFVTVILFGAGTDYCLFLISRFKEELAAGFDPQLATTRTLESVGDALAASAFTTIVGLATMGFSDFGKYRHSGPVIGFCLVIALLVCITLTPAMMRLMGRRVFWPWRVDQESLQSSTFGWWERSAGWILRSPGLILVVCLLLLAPPAITGAMRSEEVSYDFLRSLSARCPSYQGAEVMRRHFPVGEGSPVTVLAYRPAGDLESEEGAKQIQELTHALYLPDDSGGVINVRSIVDPLGDFPPGKTISLIGAQAWATRIARPHRRTEAMFLAQSEQFAGKVTRLELVLDSNPFSAAAVETLDAIETKLQQLASDPGTFWSGAAFHMTGSAAGVRDLRIVTRRDNTRIEVLVVLGVLAVLLLILKRPLICFYLIGTVMLSYYVTLGVTVLVFEYLYAESFVGLDWRTPLFLFVILVAVGQDYNVYLATRVFEEQKRLGAKAGLRRAIAQTGGIITSCGAIMAGAFISMTSSAWVEGLANHAPWLSKWGLSGLMSDTGSMRGIVELGFALALGVMLDTLLVRSILVPCFLALLARRLESRAADENGVESQANKTETH